MENSGLYCYTWKIHLIRNFGLLRLDFLRFILEFYLVGFTVGLIKETLPLLTCKPAFVDWKQLHL